MVLTDAVVWGKLDLTGVPNAALKNVTIVLPQADRPSKAAAPAVSPRAA
jgi:hypothetical protein